MAKRGSRGKTKGASPPMFAGPNDAWRVATPAGQQAWLDARIAALETAGLPWETASAQAEFDLRTFLADIANKKTKRGRKVASLEGLTEGASAAEQVAVGGDVRTGPQADTRLPASAEAPAPPRWDQVEASAAGREFGVSAPKNKASQWFPGAASADPVEQLVDDVLRQEVGEAKIAGRNKGPHQWQKLIGQKDAASISALARKAGYPASDFPKETKLKKGESLAANEAVEAKGLMGKLKKQAGSWGPQSPVTTKEKLYLDAAPKIANSLREAGYEATDIQRGMEYAATRLHMADPATSTLAAMSLVNTRELEGVEGSLPTFSTQEGRPYALTDPRHPEKAAVTRGLQTSPPPGVSPEKISELTKRQQQGQQAAGRELASGLRMGERVPGPAKEGAGRPIRDWTPAPAVDRGAVEARQLEQATERLVSTTERKAQSRKFIAAIRQSSERMQKALPPSVAAGNLRMLPSPPEGARTARIVEFLGGTLPPAATGWHTPEGRTPSAKMFGPPLPPPGPRQWRGHQAAPRPRLPSPKTVSAVPEIFGPSMPPGWKPKVATHGIPRMRGGLGGKIASAGGAAWLASLFVPSLIGKLRGVPEREARLSVREEMMDRIRMAPTSEDMYREIKIQNMIDERSRMLEQNDPGLAAILMGQRPTIQGEVVIGGPKPNPDRMHRAVASHMQASGEIAQAFTAHE